MTKSHARETHRPVPRLRVCFVCTGNVCRSPYAEGLLRHLAQRQGWPPGLEVVSAGLLDLHGRAAHPRVCAIAEEQGFSLADHRSRTLVEVDLSSCHMILGMEAQHVEAVCDLSPASTPHTYLMSAFPELHCEAPAIPDPIGEPEVVFRASCRSIEQALTKALGPISAALHARQQAGPRR